MFFETVFARVAEVEEGLQMEVGVSGVCIVNGLWLGLFLNALAGPCLS